MAGSKFGRWYAAAVLVLLPVVGFLIAQVLQPQRFASAQHCIARDALALTNSCSKTVVIAVCPSGGSEQGCQQSVLGPKQESAAPADNFTFACRQPYLPKITAGELNASVRNWSCVAPN